MLCCVVLCCVVLFYVCLAYGVKSAFMLASFRLAHKKRSVPSRDWCQASFLRTHSNAEASNAGLPLSLLRVRSGEDSQELVDLCGGQDHVIVGVILAEDACNRGGLIG